MRDPEPQSDLLRVLPRLNARMQLRGARHSQYGARLTQALVTHSEAACSEALKR